MSPTTPSAATTGAGSWSTGPRNETSPAGRYDPCVTATKSPAILQSDLEDVGRFTEEFLKRLQFGQGVSLARATKNDLYFALARTVRQQLMSRWLETLNTQMQAKAKAVAYLSAEYLLGSQLDNALLASGLTETAEKSMESLGIDLNTLRAVEVEPGLGNGGLGRLAACFIDSLATMRIPAVGYGIRYEYGIFRQTFEDGEQVEQPDSWLANGSPWEFPHPEMRVQVRFAGHTEQYQDEDGTIRTRWEHGWEVSGIPYNYMVPGYRTGNVNTPAAVERARHPGLRPAGVQHRRLSAGGASAGLRREHQQGAVPGGFHAAGQGTPAAAAVLLRGLLAARLHRQHPAARLRPAPAAGTGDLPAQRHPSGDRHPGADAHPGRRARHRLGRGVGHLPAVFRLHLPHPAAGGTRGVAGRSAGPAAPPAPGDHLPDQRRVPGRAPGRPTPTTNCGSGGCRSSRSIPSGRCGWPTWPPSAAAR